MHHVCSAAGGFVIADGDAAPADVEIVGGGRRGFRKRGRALPTYEVNGTTGQVVAIAKSKHQNPPMLSTLDSSIANSLGKLADLGSAGKAARKKQRKKKRLQQAQRMQQLRSDRSDKVAVRSTASRDKTVKTALRTQSRKERRSLNDIDVQAKRAHPRFEQVLTFIPTARVHPDNRCFSRLAVIK